MRTLFGAIAGAVVGAIVAVNLLIFSGAERGYETSLADVFDESPLLGVVVLLALLAGPVLGGWLARRSGR